MGSFLGVGLGAAGLAMNTYGSYQQAKAQKEAAQWNAHVMEEDAKYQDLLAADALQRGEGAAAIQQIRARMGRAEATAGYAASGVDVSSGSAAAVVADKAAWDEYERQQVIVNSEREAWGYTVQADKLRQQAKITKASGGNPYLAAATTAINGGHQLWRTYGG
jgi:hypothetical protein